jgi:tRNA A-37 threonylcarbamoyl transferase component Bud32
MTKSGPALRADLAADLSWLAPAGMAEDEFAPTRARLAGLLSRPLANPFYSAKRRSIYLVEDEVLGRVAIKEMRHDGPLRQFWFRHVRCRQALREFRVGSAFEARGGRTPTFLGAALDRNPLALRRVILFIHWLDGVETLTEYLRGQSGEPSQDRFDRIGASLVAAARLGLVHGRHSSENILVDSRGEEPVFYAIDFAYSRLESEMDELGFVRDVARIAQWLWHESVLSESALELFFERVARSAWSDPQLVQTHSKQMIVEFQRWRRVLAKGKAIQVRRERTT